MISIASWPIAGRRWTIPDCVDTDDDNDGVEDTSDAFPLDPAEWTDTDADGIGNNADHG